MISSQREAGNPREAEGQHACVPVLLGGVWLKWSMGAGGHRGLVGQPSPEMLVW